MEDTKDLYAILESSHSATTVCKHKLIAAALRICSMLTWGSCIDIITV